jgi:BolA protein
MQKQIKEIIIKALPNAKIYLNEPKNDGKHFEAIVIDESFEGMSLVAQHKTIMNPLKVVFATTLHAFALNTYTPKAWQKHIN